MKAQTKPTTLVYLFSTAALFFLLMGLIFTLGCSKDDPKPNPVPVPSPSPSSTPKPTPPAPTPGKDAELCKKEGKKFSCGTNEWWHLSCGGDEKNEQVYFSSKDAIMQKAVEKNLGSCVRVDGEVLPIVYSNGQGGFGPCLPCNSL